MGIVYTGQVQFSHCAPEESLGPPGIEPSDNLKQSAMSLVIGSEYPVKPVESISANFCQTDMHLSPQH